MHAVDLVMIESEKEELIRQCAAGEISWRRLGQRNFEDYVQVLGVLGALGPRPPLAPMRGPNVAARQRGIAILRKALQARK
jgi:hypothetical protein